MKNDNVIINVLLALWVNNKNDVIPLEVIEYVTENVERLLEEDELTMEMFDKPDVSITGLLRNKYVARCDLNSDIYLKMSNADAKKIIDKNEELSKLIYSILYIVIGCNNIKDKLPVQSEFVIESPDRDYYLTEQAYTFYKEKIYTDGDIIELEDITEEEYTQKHIQVVNSTFTIISCTRNDKMLSCSVRNNYLDFDFIKEKIDDVYTKRVDSYFESKNNKTYKITHS